MDWLEYDSEEASYEALQVKCDDLFKRFGIRVQTLTTDEIRNI